MLKLLNIQAQVIVALAIREIQSKNRTLEYSYIWTIIDVAITIGVLLVLKLLIKGFLSPSFPPGLFIILGALPWFTFHQTVLAMESVITKNRKLLALPNVTPLDTALGKAFEVLCIYGSTYFVMAVLFAFGENAGIPRFGLGIILVYLGCWILGIAVGLVFMPLYRIFPPANKFLGIVWRLGMMFSGVYFLISTIPSIYWPYLSWNPMLQTIELSREYWFSFYQSPVANPLYLTECIACTALLALSLERFIRRRVPA